VGKKRLRKIVVNTQSEKKIRYKQVTFKLKVRPPFSNASKTLISDGEITSGSVATANH